MRRIACYASYPTAYSSSDSPLHLLTLLETPNSYGNKAWGGIEYSFLSGTMQNNEAQRTYVDYDPVTGRAMRSVLRQQVRNYDKQ